MQISKEQIKHVATLAKLKLTEAEVEELTTQMSSIVSFVDKLNEIDVSRLSPTSHPAQLFNRMRSDEVKESMNIGDALKNAPDSNLGMFRVPGIFEE